MIRKLKAADHDECFALVNEKKAENLFLIGDIEAYGYDQEFQLIWGDFGQANVLRAVLLKYEGNYIPYAPGDFDAAGFAAIINADDHFSMMSGLTEVTNRVEPFIRHELMRKRQTYYAKCTALNLPLPTAAPVELLKAAEAEELIRMLNAVPEFSDTPMRVEQKRRALEKGTSRAYAVREEGTIVSTASTAAENSASAMIVGVATAVSAKKKGYATACVQQLTADLLKENKEVCLFYDNPQAGAIYKRIGFQDIGYWMMYHYR